MKTCIISIDSLDFTEQQLEPAAKALKNGALVAFPTETVYGLGADVLNSQAVKAIFEAKGRPSDNPLIVHISKREQLELLVKDIPAKAEILMKHFWPGPLTLVLPIDTGRCSSFFRTQYDNPH